MQPVVLVRYGEIGLKGKNRIFFEKRLIENIRDCLIKNNIKFKSIKRIIGRIIINIDSFSYNLYCLRNVFGISSYSPSYLIDKNLELIKHSTLLLIKSYKKYEDISFFRVSCSRSDKKFPLTSIQIQDEVGKFIETKTNKKVSLKNYDIEIIIEINDYAYISLEKVDGYGGLPIGSEGNVIGLIDSCNQKIAELASVLMMKRGCIVIPVSFDKINLNLIKKFAYGFKLEHIIIKDIREIEEIAFEKRAVALVSGQTLTNFSNIPVNLMILRPLIGFNQDEINNLFLKFSH